jgi:hypothetical protein
MPCSIALLALFTPLALATEGGWPELFVPSTATAPRPGDHAIIVGIEDYDHMLDVPGAERAASAWHRWFSQGLGVPSEHLRLFLGSDAHPDAIAAALTNAALEAHHDASVWLVYIGQASPGCDGTDALLFSPTAGPEAAGFIQGAVSLASLQSLLELGGHQQSVLLIDASVNERDRSLDKLGCEPLPIMPPIQLEGDHRSVLVTAAGPDEFAGSLYGTELPAFSSLMLGALRGWADADQDGSVTAAEAVTWVAGVLQATERRLPQNPEIWGTGADLVLAEAALPSPSLGEMLYEVARVQTRVSAEQLAWSPPESPPAPASPAEPDAAAQASHDQITGEMRHLSKRNAWKGVEQAFLDLEALAAAGARPSAEDLLLGAQAARALGKVDAVVTRLEQLQHLSPSPETRSWLEEIVDNYGSVNLRDRSGTGAVLSAVRMPLAPDQRATIDAAVTQVEQTGRFRGRLPWGSYRFGERLFIVVPGDAELEVVLRRR